MLVEIDKVIVNDRIRKDFGNIDGLAESIKTKGLINPPVVTPDFELIAGERRYKALRQLGYNQIEVRVMSVEDEEHMLNLEIDENEERKEFSKLERLDWARRLERIESIKAKERRISTLSQNISDVENFPHREIEGKTRDIVASKLNIGSGRQYEKEKYIEDNLHLATEEEKRAWDKGDISDHSMFKKIKAEKDIIENKAKQLEEENNKLQREKASIQSELQCEKSRKPKEIFIDNPEHIKAIESLENELKEKNKVYNMVKQNEEKYKTLMMSYQQDSENYNKLKREIESLTKQKNSLSRDMAAIEELTPFIHNVNKFIKNDLAPVKYTKAFKEIKEVGVIQQNLIDMVNLVQDWVDEIKFELNNGIKDIVNVEYTEEEF